MKNTVSILILSHNRLSELKNNIPIYVKDFPNINILVVDNNSSDGSQEYLLNMSIAHENLRVLINKENLGVAEGRNSGRKKLNSEFILHIDDDTLIGYKDLCELVNYMHDNKKVGVVSPRIIHPKSERVQNEHGSLVSEVGNYHGACHLVRKKAIDQVGDIDAGCTFGGEEIDYSIRMRKAGYMILYYPHAIAYHNNFERPDNEGFRRRKLRVYNFCRIHFKHFPLPVAIKFSIRYTMSHIVSYISLNKILCLIIFPSLMLKGMYKGIKGKEFTPTSVVKYYNDPNVRPDFGNVPIFEKIFNKGWHPDNLKR